MTANQISCQARQSIELAFRPSIFDRQVLSVDITDLAQALQESGYPQRRPAG
jgi:hypothetical protein